jgi:ribosomal protein L11
MSDSFNFRHGQQKLVSAAVNSATVIDKGDLVWQDTDDVKPASAFTWDTDLGTTQAGFGAKFMGVAYESSAAGQVVPVSIDISTDSVYEFEVANATYEIGDALSCDKASGNALLSQVLEKIVAISDVDIPIIAWALKRSAVNTTNLMVSFASAYNPSSTNASSIVAQL